MRSQSFSLGVCERRDQDPKFLFDLSSNFRDRLRDLFRAPGPPNFRVGYFNTTSPAQPTATVP